MHEAWPKGVTIVERPGKRELVSRWRAAGSPVIYVIIGGFSALCLYGAWRPFGDKLAFPPYRVLAAATGLFLVYFLFVQLLNATRVYVEEGWLVSRQGPLPWASATRVELGRVQGISFRAISGVVAELDDDEQRCLVESEYGGTDAVATLVAELIGKPHHPGDDIDPPL